MWALVWPLEQLRRQGAMTPFPFGSASMLRFWSSSGGCESDASGGVLRPESGRLRAAGMNWPCRPVCALRSVHL